MGILGKHIANFMSSETDKCKVIIKNVDAKLANQQALKAYIPDTWMFMSDWNEGEWITRAEARICYERINKDMIEKYDIKPSRIAQYAFCVLRLAEAVRFLMNIVPSQALSGGTDLNTFLEYRYVTYEEEDILNDARVVNEGFNRLQNFLDNSDKEEIETAPWYEAMETQCRHYAQMREYLHRVLLYEQEAIRLAQGGINRDNGELSFIGVDNAEQMIRDIYDWAFLPYIKDLVSLPEENQVDVANMHIVRGMQAVDSPMYDSKLMKIF